MINYELALPDFINQEFFKIQDGKGQCYFLRRFLYKKGFRVIHNDCPQSFAPTVVFNITGCGLIRNGKQVNRATVRYVDYWFSTEEDQ